MENLSVPMLGQARGQGTLDSNPIRYQGHGFGLGYNQYAKLEISKDINDVKDICVPKCADDQECTGFHFRIYNRYDGRKNGNYWFMTGKFMYVDTRPYPNHGGGVWIKELDPNSEYQDNTAGGKVTNLQHLRPQWRLLILESGKVSSLDK